MMTKETKSQVFNEAISHLQVWLMSTGVVSPFDVRTEAKEYIKRYFEATDETPGQRACKFCHSTPYRAEWRVDDWDTEAFVLGKKLNVRIRGQIDSFPIAYCPQCGRKL